MEIVILIIVLFLVCVLVQQLRQVKRDMDKLISDMTPERWPDWPKEKR